MRLCMVLTGEQVLHKKRQTWPGQRGPGSRCSGALLAPGVLEGTIGNKAEKQREGQDVEDLEGPHLHLIRETRGRC